VPNFRLTLSYDGTDFVGWQRQAQGVSIQGLLEDALAVLEGAPVTVFGAGRTDAGVHALGQVASVALTRSIDAATLRRAVNASLPASLRVLDACEVPDGFHARFSATSKSYRYRIWNAEVLSPFECRFVWHIPSPSLDAEAMGEAAARLKGRHDFSAFQAAGADTRTTERELFKSSVSLGDAAGLITLELTGSGFLRHMVRSLAGTLVEIGRRRHPATWIDEVLASKSRASAGPTAPAAGLFLVRVGYETADL
jgi:tRNA pseudouridine38-40 synthase